MTKFSSSVKKALGKESKKAEEDKVDIVLPRSTTPTEPTSSSSLDSSKDSTISMSTYSYLEEEEEELNELEKVTDSSKVALETEKTRDSSEEKGDPTFVTTDSTDDANAIDATTASSIKIMELNEAFVALENMRKANLELEFNLTSNSTNSAATATTTSHTSNTTKNNSSSSSHTTVKVNAPKMSQFQLHQFCISCLRQQIQKDKTFEQQQHHHSPSLLSNMQGSIRNHQRQRQWNVKSPPCLICASPVCKRHGCTDYRKEGIILCQDCAPLFRRRRQQQLSFN